MDALRISPKYTSHDWYALNADSAKDWSKATAVVRDRLEGRFLRFASRVLPERDSGFVVLAIDCLMAETIQQFKEGVTNGRGKSQQLIERFLEGPQFQPEFDADTRNAFYVDIRCGLLHQAEAKRMWLIRRKQRSLLKKVEEGKGFIVDVERFHARVQASLNDYLAMIIDPSHEELRSKLWTKMNHICSVRTARGALYEAEAATTG